MTGAKWTGDAAQAVELLLCKHKALSSNHNTVGKKKKKEREKMGVGVLQKGWQVARSHMFGCLSWLPFSPMAFCM
jgi:hypothetical protein